MAFTNKRTSTQRAIGYVAIPFCLAYVLWLVWPIISLISFWTKNNGPDFGFAELMAGFDWSIFWKMYLAAYAIGFVLLLGIKKLAGGRVMLHRFYNLEGFLWMVFLYPVFALSNMYTFVTCDTDFAETLGMLLQAIIKGGALYMICAIPPLAIFGRDTLKDWFWDVPLMLSFAGIILLIWAFDCLWRWDNKGRIGTIIANALYYVAAGGVIALTVCGCVLEFGNLYLDDYFALQTQITPLCLPLALLVFYTPSHRVGGGASNSVLLHILPLLIGLGLSFLGAYLLTISKILFFLMLAVPFALAVFRLIRVKGLPFRNDVAAAERFRRLSAEADARFGSIYGDSSSGGGGTNAPVKQDLPEDKGCEKLRSQLKSKHSYPFRYENYGIAFTCRVSLAACSPGRVVWEVSTTVTKRTSDPSDPNNWQRKQWQEDYLKEKKQELRSTLTSDAEYAIRDLANRYRTYGGSWSVTVRI